MGRIPAVERDALTGGLTHESAALWCYFLSEEADFDRDAKMAQGWLDLAERLSKAPQGSIHSQQLEQQIKKWSGNEQDGRLGA